MTAKVDFVKKILVTFLFVTTVITLPQMFAQNPWQRSQAWIDLNFSTPLNEKISLGGTAGLKSRSNFSDFHLWHIRARIYYNPNEKVNLHAGVGVFENLYAQGVSSTELRMEQQIALKGPRFQNFKIDHRLRIEERFYNYHAMPDLVVGNDWNGRVRYRIRAKTNDFKLFNAIDNFHFSVGAETYIPITHPASFSSSQQQIYIGFGQGFAKNQKYEFNLLWQGRIKKSITGRRDYIGFRIRYFWIRG